MWENVVYCSPDPQGPPLHYIIYDRWSFVAVGRIYPAESAQQHNSSTFLQLLMATSASTWAAALAQRTAGWLCWSLFHPLKVIPGPGAADGRGLRHGEGLGRLRLLHEQGHQPAGAGQHLRRAVEDHQQEQRPGLLCVQPLWGDTQGGLCVCVYVTLCE